MSYGIQHINVAATADGDNALVTGVEGKIIQVVSYNLNVVGAGLAILRDATAHTARATLQGAATTGIVYTFSGTPHSPAFVCAPGEGLEVNNAAGIDTQGHLSYRLV